MSVGSVGSGLDINALVSQLVSAERAPTSGRIDRTERQTNAQISALGALRGAFESLRTATTKLGSSDAALARKVSVQTEAGFSATASAGAATGNFQIEVLALATAHKLSSTAHPSGDSIVGTGTLSIVSGETTLSIEIDGSNNSLTGIRNAINQASAGKGVTATVVNADDGAHLVISATQTGASNALTITSSGGDGGLASLDHDLPNPTTMTTLSAAADALVEIDGLQRSSSSNTITDMLEGVSLTLTKAVPGTIKELAVSGDPSVLRNDARSFINAYNIALGTIATTTKYDTSTKIAAALNGDAMVRGASRDLRNQVSASVNDLKALGITVDLEGKLTMDDAAFDSAMAKDAGPANRLFSASDSLAAGIGKSLAGLLDLDGAFSSRDQGLARRTQSIADQRSSLDRRISLVEARYRAQFVALDQMMAKLQSTSSFLSQQLARPAG